MEKKINNPTLIRSMREADRPGIINISRHTWDGDDYLEKEFDNYLKEGNMYVLETEGQIAGCAALSFFPDKVLWLEALRVHPGFMERGFGRMLYDFAIEKGEKLKNDGTIDCLEFSTYYQNYASISMAEKGGFWVIEKLYAMSYEMKGNENMTQTISCAFSSEHYLSAGDRHISAGWHFVRNTPDGLKYLRNNTRPFKANNIYFHLSGPYNTAYCPELNTRNASDLKGALCGIFKDQGYFELLFEDTKGELVKLLLELGLEFWDEPKEPNVLIYRK